MPRDRLVGPSEIRLPVSLVSLLLGDRTAVGLQPCNTSGRRSMTKATAASLKTNSRSRAQGKRQNQLRGEGGQAQGRARRTARAGASTRAVCCRSHTGVCFARYSPGRRFLCFCCSGPSGREIVFQEPAQSSNGYRHMTLSIEEPFPQAQSEPAQTDSSGGCSDRCMGCTPIACLARRSAQTAARCVWLGTWKTQGGVQWCACARVWEVCWCVRG